MADIFLSYEGTDRHRVAPIVALLETYGWSVSWDQDADAGGVRGQALERELAAARCVVAAWSADAVESDTVWADAGQGLARGILISVSVDFSRPPSELDGAPSIAFAGWTGDASSPRAQELIAAVGAAIEASADAAMEEAPEEPASLAVDEPPEQIPEPPAVRRIAVSSDAPTFIQRAASTSPLQVDPDATEIETDLPVDRQRAVPNWAAAADAEDQVEDQSEVGLPPVLVRGLVPRPEAAEPSQALPRARSSGGIFAVALCAGLAIIAVITVLRIAGGGGEPEPSVESAAVTPAPTAPAPSTSAPPTRAPDAPRKPVATPTRAAPAPAAPSAPAEVKPTTVALTKPPAAEPTPPVAGTKPMEKTIEVEDLLADMTPRVEELLAGARRLIRVGDIRGAREMLQAPETAQSRLLTFLLAETYDPNVLPAPLKRGMADPERAKALYRRAGELGDDRAQGRLNALKS